MITLPLLPLLWTAQDQATPLPGDLIGWINTAVQATFLALFVLGFIVPQRLVKEQIDKSAAEAAKALTASEERNNRLSTKNDELQKAIYDALTVTKQQSELLAVIANRLEVIEDGNARIRQPAPNSRRTGQTAGG